MASLARAGSSAPGIGRIIQNFGWTDPDNFVNRVDQFLRRVFVYRDEEQEVLRDVPFMLNDLETVGYMMGDCDDMSIMGCAILCRAGISCRMTAIKSSSPDEFDHVFSEARIGTHWIPVDPTVPKGTQYLQYGFMSEAVC